MHRDYTPLRAVLWALLLTALFARTAHAQTPVQPGTPPIALTSPLRFSGYVQAQYTHADMSKTGLKDATTPNNLDKVEIRRGRLKLVYAADLTELALQIDATQNGVALRDAEASLVKSWSELAKLKLTLGQFKIPYSYDTLVGSQMRWLPERSQLAQRFFPGERDLGARLSGDISAGRISYALAVLNGQAIGEKAFPGLDPNKHKDVVAHLGLKLGPVSFGASGYYGTGYLSPAIDDETTPQNEAHRGLNYRRWSYGPDLRLNLDLPGLGSVEVFGEFAYARNMGRGSLADLPPVQRDASGNARNKVTDRDQLAWYVVLNQKVGKYTGVACRAEQITLDLSDAQQTATNVEPALLAFLSDTLWATFSYVHRMEHARMSNDQLWLRLQAKYAVP